MAGGGGCGKPPPHRPAEWDQIALCRPLICTGARRPMVQVKALNKDGFLRLSGLVSEEVADPPPGAGRWSRCACTRASSETRAPLPLLMLSRSPPAARNPAWKHLLEVGSSACLPPHYHRPPPVIWGAPSARQTLHCSALPAPCHAAVLESPPSLEFHLPHRRPLAAQRGIAPVPRERLSFLFLSRSLSLARFLLLPLSHSSSLSLSLARSLALSLARSLALARSLSHSLPPPLSHTLQAQDLADAQPPPRSAKLAYKNLGDAGAFRLAELLRAPLAGLAVLDLSCTCVPTREATQGQILSQSPTDATRFWWHLYGSRLQKPSNFPWVASRVEAPSRTTPPTNQPRLPPTAYVSPAVDLVTEILPCSLPVCMKSPRLFDESSLFLARALQVFTIFPLQTVPDLVVNSRGHPLTYSSSLHSSLEKSDIQVYQP